MIRIALKFMKFDKAKSIGVIVGIVVSTFLIGQQIGILSFLTGLMGGLVNNSPSDIAQIWVIDDITTNANNLAKLDERKVYEVMSVEGVEATYPIFVGGGTATFENGKTSAVTLVGSEPPLFVAGPVKSKIYKGDIFSLANQYTVSADFYDQKIFASPTEIGTNLEINGRKAIISVQTKNARGFGGSFIYTSLDKARQYTNASEYSISAVAVKVKPGYTPEQVVKSINSAIPNIRAWTAEDLRSSTVMFLVFSSNIGTSIGSLVVFAILSGFFIIGLTLYSAAIDRIKDYGTLKAIGARNSYITKLMITQAIIYSITGFIIAIALLEGFRAGVSSSGLLFTIGPYLSAALLFVTLLISLGSTLFFSVRTIRKVEPASVFR